MQRGTWRRVATRYDLEGLVWKAIALSSFGYKKGRARALTRHVAFSQRWQSDIIAARKKAP